MFKEPTKAMLRGFAAAILLLLLFTLFFCVVPGCVSPNAVKTDIQGIRTNLEQLEEIVDQKADNTVVAEHVDEINNKIEQTAQIAEELSLWKKNVQAEVINYGGAGWVVIGTCVMAVIFIGAGFLLIKAFMNRGNLLTLLTCAVQKAGVQSPETIKLVKAKLTQEVADGRFREVDRKNLSHFAQKVGTFSEQKQDLAV